jgi:hypothetical protein
MKYIQLNKLINFIHFLEDEDDWEEYNISGYDILESHSLNFQNEIKNNIFGKNNLEKNDIISEYVFDIYNNILILESFITENPINNSKEFYCKFLSETYENSINSIIYICLRNGIDFTHIVLNLKLKMSLFNLDSYNEAKIFLLNSDNNNNNNNIDESKLFIFKNPKAYQMFIHFYEIYKLNKTYLSDISFIYRIMYEEKLIKEFCRPEIFRSWLTDNKLLNTKSSISTNLRLKLDKRYLLFSEVRDRILNS